MAAWLTWAALPCAIGQTPPAAANAANQAAEQAQREQQDRNNQQFNKDRQSAQPPSTLVVPAPKLQQLHGANVRRHIRELRLEGATLMRRHFREQLLREYHDRDLSLQDLEQLLADITAYYLRRGYVTARAYVPPQDLSTGILLIHVEEGRVQRLSGESWAHNVFPTKPGDILNLRDLEQGIDNLNRLSSRHATMNIVPGTVPGETDVAVTDPLTKPWHVSLSDDDTGQKNTGRNQSAVGLILDSPLGVDDQLSLNYRRAEPYRVGTASSDAGTASYIVPWGYSLFTAGASLSNYALAFNAPSGSALPFTGDNRSLFLRADRLLYRGQVDRLTLSGMITWKAARNYLLGGLIGVTSRELTNLDLELNYSTAWKGFVINATAGASGAVPIFGGLEDASGLPAYAPRAQAVKFTGSLNVSKAFTVEGIDCSINSSVTGQESSRVLYGTEQLTVGGIYAVRGFDSTTLAGDSGYVWRNDFSVPMHFAGPWRGRFGPWTVRPYVGADVGEAFSSISGIPGYSGPAGTLVGLTGGVAVALGSFNAEVFYAKSVRRASSMSYEPGHPYFKVNYTF
jgi:hemolysin activation/secretion protein